MVLSIATPPPFAPSKPTRPALRWMGSKWRSYSKIAAFVPDHQLYVEGFGGSASFLLRKPCANYEVYNDLDNSLVNFWRVLKHQGDELIAALSKTLYLPQTLLTAQQVLLCQKGNALEQACAFFVVAWMSRDGLFSQRQDAVFRWSKRDNLAKEYHEVVWRLGEVRSRIAKVLLCNDSYLQMLDSFDSSKTLFYFDPPYLDHTRRRFNDYRYRYDWQLSDHVQMLERLSQGVLGKVIVSTYASYLYPLD